MPQLMRYLYVDRATLDQFMDQLNISSERAISKLTSKASVSLTGPKLESSREYSYDEPQTHKSIELVTKALQKASLMRPRRPDTIREAYDYEGQKRVFGLETVNATKVTFLKKHFEQLSGVSELAVWIADPIKQPNPSERYDFSTSFLVLPQMSFDKDGFQSVYSSCSALQAVVNGYRGSSLLLGANGEPLGRGSYMHPVEKLRELGGLVSRPMSIRVLYRMRYMTDEQCCTINGQQYRVHDLMAYPVYIAAT